MKKAYQNMRAFWLDATNFQTRKGLIEIGPDKIVAACVELAVADGNMLKHVWIATNSLGDSSFYFENNSPSGLGGMIGGHGNEPLQQAAAHMLAHAARLTPQMQPFDAQEERLPLLTKPSTVGLWAVAQNKLFYKELTEEQARSQTSDFYPMFAYSQQMIGLFAKQN